MSAAIAELDALFAAYRAAPTARAAMVVNQAIAEFAAAPGVFFNGDNLAVLRFIPDESVDLIYLDPPFNSQRNYNAIFKGARAQERAFKDCWSWEDDAAQTYERLVNGGYAAPSKVIDLMRALRELLGPKDLMAYLTMMSVRLVALHRVLKPTGSLYLHCDATASHYLKLLLDAIFGPERFLNEVIWKRTGQHGGANRYGPVHDVLLFYSKSDNYVWTDLRGAPDPEYIAEKFTESDPDGRKFQGISLTGAGTRQGESGEPWRGIDPTEKGRHWAIPRTALKGVDVAPDATVQQKLDALDAAGKIKWPTRGDQPRLKWYADELRGAALPDVWTDIAPLNSQAQERTAYPTQKPIALLARILGASSKPGDLVLDPFCGCGTTIEAAQRLGRRWIGIDIADIAVDVVRDRLDKVFPGIDYALHYIPPDLAAAKPTTLPRIARLPRGPRCAR